MGVSLSDIAGNLYNISHVASKSIDPEDVKNHLVPSLWGNRLYAKGFTKKVLEFLYPLIDKYLIPNFRQQRFFSVINKTSLAYQTYAEKLRESLSRHQGDPITDWNNWVYPVLQNHVWQNLEAISKVFAKEIPGTLLSTNEFWKQHFIDTRLAAKEQKIIDVEDTINAPFPRDSLGRIAKDEALIQGDEEKIKDWIKVLNNSISKSWWQRITDPARALPVRKLHRVLQVFAEQINPLSLEMTTSLEFKIYSLGCVLLLQKDDKHIRWKESLTHGSQISYFNGNEKQMIEIDQKIDMPKGVPEVNEEAIFTIKDDPYSVIVVGVNEAIGGIEEQLSIKDDKEIPIPAVLHRMDPSGRFKIKERLKQPLSSIVWQSTSDTLHETDSPLVGSLVKAIKSMMDQDCSPKYFMPAFIYLDSDSRLRSFKQITKETFNINTIVSFLRALENPFIYKHIVNKLDLNHRQESTCYRAVVDNAFKGSDKEEVLNLTEECLKDNRIALRARDLDKEIEKALNKCIKDIEECYEVGIWLNELKTALVVSIKKTYENNLCIGQLGKTFCDDVFKAVLPWLQSKNFVLRTKVLEKQIQAVIHELSKNPELYKNFNNLLTSFGILELKQRQQAQNEIDKAFKELWR